MCKHIAALLIFCVLLLLQSCTTEQAASNPFSLAPDNPYSTWSPWKKNTLISAQYCSTVLPENFPTEKVTLGELIDIALQNNPQTKQTWAEARAAAANYGQSLSTYFPELDFTGTYTRVEQTFAEGGIFSPFFLTTITPEATLSYTVFDFGKRRATSEDARQALYYADYTHNQEIQTIMQTVMNDYYDLTYQKQQFVALEYDLENAQATLDAANQKFKFGVAALGDVAMARSKYLQTKIDLVTQRKTVEDAFNKLANDVGLPATVKFEVEDLPEKVVIAPMMESVEAMVETAQLQRQDLLASQANIRSKKAALDKAKADPLPDITSYFDVGRDYYGISGQHERIHWTIQFQLTFPIFRGYYYRNGIRKAESDLQKAQAEFLQTELTIIQEVMNARIGVDTSSESLVYSEEYVEAAEEEFDIALSNYKVGTNTILDVLSAQSSLADARAKLANAKKDWYESIANLAYATGALCTPPGPRLTELKEIYQQ